jgi:hypothetical protein
MDAEFTHTVVFLNKGLPKKNFEQKIIFCEKPIELWGFDGINSENLWLWFHNEYGDP